MVAWAEYIQQIEEHSNSNHSKDHEDDSCEICHQAFPSIETDDFKNFIKWYKEEVVGSIHWYTGRTWIYFKSASETKTRGGFTNYIRLMILSIRYKNTPTLDFDNL